MLPRLIAWSLRLFYRHFYNRLAWTYDPVSALVSRGEWRGWTRAGIPFVQGPRILEIAFGTGNLELDLNAAGFAPIGVDLSPYMGDITRNKLRAHHLPQRLVRAPVQQLPFPDASFDSLIMTFPPGFVVDPHAMQELRRVLAPAGRLIWVDAAYLYPRDPWSAFLNWALVLSGTGPDTSGETRERDLLSRWAEQGWSWRTEKIERPTSQVRVTILTVS